MTPRAGTLLAALLYLTAGPAAAQPAGDGEPGDAPAATPAAAPDMDAATETDDEEEEETGQDAIDTVIDVRPPARLREWEIAGTLTEPPEVVRALLSQQMAEREGWTDDDQKDVQKLLERFGYVPAFKHVQLPTGGVKVVIDLKPITLVRHVDVDLDVTLIETAYQPLFADEVQRRMSIRPGSPLPSNPAERDEKLRSEADRLADYLRNDGFYEAEVSVKAKDLGYFTARIDVDVDPGPPYFIGQINVVGNTAMETSEITKEFRHPRLCLPFKIFCIGVRRFSRRQLNEDLDRLEEMYKKRGFPGVRIKSDFDLRHSFNRASRSVDFTLTIRERRKIDVVFEGNTGSRTDDILTDELTLSEQGSYDDLELENSAAALRSYYQSKGYFEANITWERVRFGLFERVVYSIDEGQQLKVRQVTFTGNESISRDDLYDAIKTRTFKRIIVGKSGGFATSVQLSQDMDRILDLYRRRGFRDASVKLLVSRDPTLSDSTPALAASIAADLPSDGLYVFFYIEEGPRVMVQDVVFEFVGQNPLMDPDLLESTLKLRAEAPFLEEQMAEDNEALRRLYFSRGFPRAEINTVVREVGPDRVVIAHEITENSPAHVGDVILRGNFKTRDWVILDEMELSKGQRLTMERAEIAQSNLRQSGLFSSVQIDYDCLIDCPRRETVNLLVKVEERHDHFAAGDFGFGYSSDSKGFVEGNIGTDNLRGVGVRLDNRALVGQEKIYLESKATLPRWVMRRVVGTRLRLETNGVYRWEETERFGNLVSYGAGVAVSKEGRRGFWEGWLLSMRYDFRLRNRDVNLVRPAGNSNDIDREKVDTRSSAIGPLLVIDKRRDHSGRRNPLAPTDGFRLELKAQFAENYLFGTDRFIKTGAGGQHFWGLTDRLVLSNGLRYDHGFPLGGRVLLPEIERYFAGGDTTVRGFEEDRLATEIIEEPIPPLGDLTRVRVLPAGGNIRFIHNLDLQLTVWDDALLGFPIASAIFLDTGLVTNSFDGFEVTDLRHSLGLTMVRWVTAFGSISAEWAVPLDPGIADNPRGRFHFNVGGALSF